VDWTVDLTVKYVPCPPEQAAAWWAAMKILWEMAGMRINPNHRGRTSDGKATYRTLIEWDEDDYPPDSKYWMSLAHQAAKRLAERMGYEPYCEWIDAQEEPAHWRGLYDLVKAKESELDGIGAQLQDSTVQGAAA
jgi:hypothetical protein